MSHDVAFDFSLHGVHVGRLLGPSPWLMEFDPTWVGQFPRAVLGQWFEDRDLRRARTSPKLFAYFRNLLPERSAVRSLVARSNGFAVDDETALLACVGKDLPGALAVTVAAAAGEPPANAIFEPGFTSVGYRFSLAGVQPKMSVRISDDYRAVVPVAGADGHWILKLPNDDYPRLPELEFATMSWARDAGFEVPETRLIDPSTVDALPPALARGTGQFYLIRRFDREGGRRLHQEDFAQVLDRQPEHKYECEAVRLSQVVKGALGPDEHLRFLDRLVFDLMAGNGDAHLKNWSILYRDALGQTPTLAPCYDIVPTVLYPGQERSPGLAFPGKPKLDRLDSSCFKKLLRNTKDDSPEVWLRLSLVAQRAADMWRTVAASRFESGDRAQIEAQFMSVPVVRDWLGVSAT